MSLIEWLADRFAWERFEIGRLGDVYMVRWTLAGAHSAGSGV